MKINYKHTIYTIVRTRWYHKLFDKFKKKVPELKIGSVTIDLYADAKGNVSSTCSGITVSDSYYYPVRTTK